MTLKAKSTGTAFEEDTTFRLVPVIEGDDDVNFGSYARIYHLHTESWLHALRGTVCTSCTLHKCQDEEFDNYVCIYNFLQYMYAYVVAGFPIYIFIDSMKMSTFFMLNACCITMVSVSCTSLCDASLQT